MPFQRKHYYCFIKDTLISLFLVRNAECGMGEAARFLVMMQIITEILKNLKKYYISYCNFRKSMLLSFLLALKGMIFL